MIFIPERLDVYKWIQEADMLVQLSDTEACSYAINEALGYGKQVVITPLPYIDEIGIRENAIVLNFDCSNIDEVVEQIRKPRKVNWTIPEDNYKKYLVYEKSTYEERKKTMKTIRIKANIKKFIDMKYHNLPRKPLEPWLEDDERADDLIRRGFAEEVPETKPIVIEPEKEELPEAEQIEEAIKDEPKKEKAVRKTTVKKTADKKKDTKKNAKK